MALNTVTCVAFGRKARSPDDYYRRDGHVHVPRRQLRGRGGRVVDPLPDHAGTDVGPLGGDGQLEVEAPLPHAARADRPAPRRLLVHRRGQGPRSVVTGLI